MSEGCNAIGDCKKIPVPRRRGRGIAVTVCVTAIRVIFIAGEIYRGGSCALRHQGAADAHRSSRVEFDDGTCLDS